MCSSRLQDPGNLVAVAAYETVHWQKCWGIFGYQRNMNVKVWGSVATDHLPLLRAVSNGGPSGGYRVLSGHGAMV